jgi:hypothetical protein
MARISVHLAKQGIIIEEYDKRRNILEKKLQNPLSKYSNQYISVQIIVQTSSIKR